MGPYVRFVVRGLLQHSADVDSPALDPDNMKFICVDLTTSEFSTIASGKPNAVEIFIARENQNHFLPLRVSNTPLQALRAWNTNVPLTRAAEAAEARRLAAESDAALRRETDALAAEKAKQEQLKQAAEAEARAGEPPNTAINVGDVSVAEIDEVTLPAEIAFGELSGAQEEKERVVLKKKNRRTRMRPP